MNEITNKIKLTNFNIELPSYLIIFGMNMLHNMLHATQKYSSIVNIKNCERFTIQNLNATKNFILWIGVQYKQLSGDIVCI